MIVLVRRAVGQPAATIAGAVIVGVAMLLAVVGLWLAPFDPEKPTQQVLLSPSGGHPFGTDASGLDVFSVVVAAFRVDALIAVVAIGISLVFGILIGALSGYGFNGNRLAAAVSSTLLRVLDLMQSIPAFILALALVGMTGPSVQNVVIAVAFVNIPVFARLTRTAIRGTEQQEFVAASRAIGVRESSILVRHVIPNSIDSTIAYASIAVGGAILLTASLSFLGAGVRRPTPEWGAEIAMGAGYVITGQWWISVLPGLVLSIVVLGFALLGDAVQGWLRRAHGRALPSPDCE